MKLLDTIAAISTPHGKGGVAVLRVSGQEAVAIASRVFVPKSGKALGDCTVRSAIYGTILVIGHLYSPLRLNIDDVPIQTKLHSDL